MTSTRRISPGFRLEIVIRVPLVRLHAYLCDLHNYVPLHPLIESIEEIDAAAELPRATRYRVVDRIPLGPLKLRVTYVAALEAVSDFEVHGHAWQSAGVRLETVYTLSDLDADRGTRLEERVSVAAPLGLRRFVTRQARSSHETTLRRMKAHLEGSRRPD